MTQTINFPRFNKVPTMLVTLNGVPLLIGSTVTFDNAPAIIQSMNEVTGWVYIQQHGLNLRAYPRDIGAKWLF
jgi:hypothetical protein